MNPVLKFAAIGMVVLASAAAVSSCGNEDNSSDSPPAPRQQAQPNDQSQGAQMKKNGSGPASASDKRPTAPDDKISDRPGGPRDSGKQKGLKGKKKGASSGGISMSTGSAVSPVSP